jgi:hypothetical protein
MDGLGGKTKKLGRETGKIRKKRKKRKNRLFVCSPSSSSKTLSSSCQAFCFLLFFEAQKVSFGVAND